ncbi:aldo/keto reductase [Tumebacillus sp. DT12]|uniref:Aldo/keto reductase n=1 Tax=Tumebacillus lacus TaxID=2995335 RepID=A0ABT3X7D7_9BACL|nr:aldo/keto reductase [Tumebacillus lacus]MCX7572351.1 aldo/keto reductase [Tumebacillus lacus]
MQYVNLGRAGVKVSRYCLGTMMFGSWGIDEKESVKVIHRALDAGINFYDMADIYGGGTSEEIVGRALQHKRDEVILATKFKIRTEEGPNGEGASRYRIMRQVEESLKRLGTDYIDLYQIHRPDPTTPLDETMRALDDLVRQGKVRYIGCSNFDAWRIVESLWISDKMNLERFVTNQPSYSLLDRHIEQEIRPVSERYGLATLCYSPLGGGWLTGKYNNVAAMPEGSRGEQHGWDFTTPENQDKLRKVERLTAMAERKEITLAQLALAWLLHQGDSVIPIIGAKSVEQLNANLSAFDVQLSADELAEIENIVPSPYFDFSK